MVNKKIFFEKYFSSIIKQHEIQHLFTDARLRTLKFSCHFICWANNSQQEFKSFDRCLGRKFVVSRRRIPRQFPKLFATPRKSRLFVKATGIEKDPQLTSSRKPEQKAQTFYQASPDSLLQNFRHNSSFHAVPSF